MYQVTIDGVVTTWQTKPERFNGVIFAPDTTDEEYASYGIIYAADPIIVVEPKTKFTRLEFFQKFTNTELVNIYTTAKTDIQIEIMLDQLKMASYIDVTDPTTITGVNSLEQFGLIETGRAATILEVQSAS